MTTVNFTASITRNYGKMSATFGASYEKEVKGTDDSRQAYEALLIMIAVQFDEFEAGNIAKHHPENDQKSAALEEKQVDKIELTIWKGKKVPRVFTSDTRFSKFGIPVYDDELVKLCETIMKGELSIDLKGAGVMVKYDPSKGGRVKALWGFE